MLHILVVDDSPANVLEYTQWFHKCGIRVSGVASAEEGFTVAKTMQPNIIITELELPGLSGFQAIRVLKSDPNTATIPVIVVANRKQNTDITWALRQGAHSYLCKPVAEVQLVDHVQRLLSGDVTRTKRVCQN